MEYEEPELVSEITEIKTIAVNLSIRDLEWLRQQYGGTRWRKLKGQAYTLREDGRIVLCEVHWYH